jgi:alkaline phosphatase D
LGNTQWQWLEKKIENSQANFLVIVSSIQLLSNQHQFEKWENLPHERERMINLISRYSEKNIFVVSGDRHISEFSIMPIGEKRQLIDFTSSGLTHSYSSFSGEPNPFRVKEVVSDRSYGIIDFNLKDNTLHAYMMGDKKQIRQELEVSY